jgi:hypothetical protein
MATYPVRTPGPLGTLEDRVSQLEQQLRRVTSPTAEQYAQAVANLNAVDTVEGSSYGGGQNDAGVGSGAWFEWVNLWAEVAPGKNFISGLIVAQAVMVDMTSGGGATLSMRIVQRYPSGFQLTSVVFQAAKNSGASAVNNVVNGSARIAVADLAEGDHVEISIQVAATNPAAFPSNSSNFVQASSIFVSSNQP